MDWEKCIICGGGGDLKCPARSLQGNAPAVYETFINILHEFSALGELPAPVTFDISQLESTDLFANSAKWHKACHLKFAQTKLNKKKRQVAEHEVPEVGTIKKPRRSEDPKQVCIFCQQRDGKLHECTTFQIDQNIRDMATALQDTAVIGRLCGGDVIALESKYHLDCLTAFRNRYRSKVRSDRNKASNEDKQLLEARCFAELVSHIHDRLDEGQYIFPLQDLHTVYESRRRDLLGVESDVNRTRLKDKLLSHFQSHCQEQSSGRNRMLVFTEGLGDLLKEVTDNPEKDVLKMMQVAKQVRKDIFDKDDYTFNGSFPPECQSNCVPRAVLNLVSLLLNGTSIEDQAAKESQSCLSIAQLICFNAKKKQHREKNVESKQTRTTRSREMPLPLYIGLKIHTQSRNKALVDQLYSLGLSINYKRVLQIENNLAHAVTQKYHSDGIVCPPNLRKGLYTVGAIDNVDHNPSSQTSKGSFHGTGISIFQTVTDSNQGESRGGITFVDASGPIELPEKYSIVPAVACSVSALNVPERISTPGNSVQRETDVLKEEKEWLQDALELLKEDEACGQEAPLTWSAHHSNKQRCITEKRPGIGALLPLFYEKAASISMIKHGIDVVRNITEHLNPGQVPVIACDQPLFALVKYVQWAWPNSYGEHKLVAMLGGLHTEMSYWKIVGDLLDKSGWSVMMAESEVATAGRAESYVFASHLKRTRHAHQVTAVALSQLEREAYEKLKKDGEDTETWKGRMMTQSPTFHYWQLILELELLGMAFVRAQREDNLELYVQCQRDMAPWFFALDHQNYSRWLAVHISNLENLPENLIDELKQGWTFTKTSRPFSSMPLDQVHEQHNAIVKGSGGAVGLTENPGAFKKWMVAGPEQAILVMDFEQNVEEIKATKHLEAAASHQKTFREEVVKLAEKIKVECNPFLEEGPELMTLHNRQCFSAVADTVLNIKRVGKEKYRKFKTTVLDKRDISIHAAIKRNNFPLFKTPEKKVPSKLQKALTNMKQDCSLFSRMYISCQVRTADTDAFFRHENVLYPPSFSDNGELHLPTKKSDLLECIDTGRIPNPPVRFDAVIVDGATLVHSLSTIQARTFQEYAEMVFLPWIDRQLATCDRLDIIWDSYDEDSLKGETRLHRGVGTRRKVSPTTKLPVNFPDFLRNSKNKEELFQFLTDAVVSKCTVTGGKELHITSGGNVASLGQRSANIDVTGHEEADTKIVAHIQDALGAGYTSILVTTVDTDVVVILTGTHFQTISCYPDADVWVGFGPKKTFRYYHINTIYDDWGPQMCIAMPFFHALTGSDTTSQFLRHGKKGSWKTWQTFNEATETFSIPANDPFQHVDESSRLLRCVERFVCLLYEPSTDLESVNDQRREMFCQKGKQMDALPPTQASLLQHVRRAVFQSSVWYNSNTSLIEKPSPEQFGWRKNVTGWTPHWTDLPVAAKACRELLRCGCKALPKCSRKCRCHEAGLQCTSLCACVGDCDYDSEC